MSSLNSNRLLAIDNPVLLAQIGALRGLAERATRVMLRVGLMEIDQYLGGLPRGRISEVIGAASSGRTALSLSVLRAATTQYETCAWVDTHNSFDPVTAAEAGIDLTRVLWVRCDGKLENAMKATDYLINAGGFGVVVLDVIDADARKLQNLPQSNWVRLQRAVEKTNTILLLTGAIELASSCTTLRIVLERIRERWQGKVFNGVESRLAARKPIIYGNVALDMVMSSPRPDMCN